MENQEYLNQISAKTTPAKPNKGSNGILHSKIFYLVIGTVIAVIILAIVGSFLGSNKTDNKTSLIALRLHVDSTMNIIDKYQPNVKSSSLRSSSASLNSILTDTNNKLNTYITEKYGDKATKDTDNLAEQAKTTEDALEAELSDAKINGILDRVYAHKMAYEISLFLSEESKLYNSTKDENLQSILADSYNSLENLYSNFNDFSETKQ